jgi:hypothetical protein
MLALEGMMNAKKNLEDAGPRDHSLTARQKAVLELLRQGDTNKVITRRLGMREGTATEKAGIEAALNRCRGLAAQIESELRNKRPEHFVDKLSLADFHASLEYAADVLGQQSRQTETVNECS